MAAPTVRVRNETAERDGESTLHLTVMGPNAFDTHPLPAAGSVTIGRDEQADVRITDPDASRSHARLHIGAQIEIEDLDSANGTRLREKYLPPGQRVPLSPGEAVAIGSTVLMVQRRRPTFRPRRVWPHGYFEGRLEEECERAARPGSTFAVLRLRITRGPGDAAADVFARLLRAGDVLALYAPNEYEALLVDTEPAAAETLVRQIDSEISHAGLACRTGLAIFPSDGRTAQTLIERLSAALRSREKSDVTPAGGRAAEPGAEPPVLSSEAMRKLYFLAERAAAGGINVLILGETGVGKEVLAQAIHRMSPRAAGPFICINCAALSESLLESELFGHEKGAFTGALQAKAGLLEAASGGTVFLDEIGEMPLNLQSKILRAIELRQVTRVGSVTARPIDVRFLAATNRDLEEEVAARRFRQDLYFRLNGMSLTIPPLRERLSEIEPLARHFLVQASGSLKRPVPLLSAPALAVLGAYPWPGNIRELRNIMERAVLLCDGSEITPEQLPLEKMRVAPGEQLEGSAPASVATSDALSPAEQSERRRLVEALERCMGNQTRAAALLGISRRSLCEKLRVYRIPRPRR